MIFLRDVHDLPRFALGSLGHEPGHDTASTGSTDMPARRDYMHLDHDMLSEY